MAIDYINLSNRFCQPYHYMRHACVAICCWSVHNQSIVLTSIIVVTFLDMKVGVISTRPVVFNHSLGGQWKLLKNNRLISVPLICMRYMTHGKPNWMLCSDYTEYSILIFSFDATKVDKTTEIFIMMIQMWYSFLSSYDFWHANLLICISSRIDIGFEVSRIKTNVLIICADISGGFIWWLGWLWVWCEVIIIMI